MLIIGRLKKRCKWRIVPNLTMGKSRLAKLCRNIPAQYHHMAGDVCILTCAPVIRARLVPKDLLGTVNRTWWLFTLASDPAFLINITSKEMLRLMQQALADPRTFVRGDGSIRADLVMQKRGERVSFRLLEPGDEVVWFKHVQKECAT